MKNKAGHISYSNLLLQFIEPILDGTEDEEAFMTKANMGKIAWNFCVSDQAELSIDHQMKTILKKMLPVNPQAKQILDQLVIRKQTRFAQYDQVIFDIEIRTQPDGSKTFYVESAPASAFNTKSDND